MRYTGTFLAAALFLFSCRQPSPPGYAVVAEAQPAPQPHGEFYKADLGQTHIEWIGTGLKEKHHGTFMLREGGLWMDRELITGGRFVIDMKTLRADDRDSAGNASLANYLLSETFFNANSFPNVLFEITGVRENKEEQEIMDEITHSVTGNLLVGNVTNSITFPAYIRMHEGQVTAEAGFVIHWDDWGIIYHNKKPRDTSFIHPEVNVRLHLVARKESQ